ncbi:AraC family transcriptional regulator [Lachnospiraceae bacterium ZAX-1]
MMEYRSVHDAAVAWGVSERRVHKLCEDNRIAGLIRLGRTWGIPKEADKPADERVKNPKSKGGDQDAENRILDSWLGPDAKLSFQREGCAVYQLENETGNGIVTIYDVFPGIRLFYNDLHLSKITGHDDAPADGAGDMLEINHCREGRFECELQKGEFAYMGEGDLSANVMSAMLQSSRFPLAHYHGVSIVMDIPCASKAMESLSTELGMVSLDPLVLKNRLLTERPYFILRGTESISHIFSELYNAPDSSKESYIRLKVLELMLFLNIVDLDHADERQYYHKTRVDAIKAMHGYLTTHMNEQFTLEVLSARFGIPLTSMKSCFKSMFGAPIHAYMREYRLQAAAVMLRETDKSIADIADEVGYGSHAKFSSAFRSATGVTPSDYRKVVVQKG